MKRTATLCVLGTMVIGFAVVTLHGFRRVQGEPQNGVSKRGLIAGIVVNSSGLPISQAEVIAVWVGAYRGQLPRTLTDNEGKFELRGIKPGTYFIEARKESEGYSSTLGSFHSSGFVDAPQITVVGDERIDNVVLKLGPKAARLIGRIIDAKTKKPVENAEIILRRADNPKQFYSASVENRFNVLVPPSPFTVEVKASGYELWSYSNDGSGKHLDALKLASGQRKDLTIALRAK